MVTERFRKGNRPRIRIIDSNWTGPASRANVLTGLNGKTAYFRNKYVVGEMAIERDRMEFVLHPDGTRVMDREPYPETPLAHAPSFMPADNFGLTPWDGRHTRVPGDMRKVDVDVDDGNPGGATVCTIAVQIVEPDPNESLGVSRVRLTVEDYDGIDSIVIGDETYVVDRITGLLKQA